MAEELGGCSGPALSIRNTQRIRCQNGRMADTELSAASETETTEAPPRATENRSTTPRSDAFQQYISTGWAERATGIGGPREQAPFAAARRARLSGLYTGVRLLVPAGDARQRIGHQFVILQPPRRLARDADAVRCGGAEAEPGVVDRIADQQDQTVTERRGVRQRPLDERGTDALALQAGLDADGTEQKRGRSAGADDDRPAGDRADQTLGAMGDEAQAGHRLDPAAKGVGRLGEPVRSERAVEKGFDRVGVVGMEGREMKHGRSRMSVERSAGTSSGPGASRCSRRRRGPDDERCPWRPEGRRHGVVVGMWRSVAWRRI